MNVSHTFCILLIAALAACEGDYETDVVETVEPEVTSSGNTGANGETDDEQHDADTAENTTVVNTDFTYAFNDKEQTNAGNSQNGNTSGSDREKENDKKNDKKNDLTGSGAKQKENDLLKKIFPEKNWGNFLDSLKPKEQVFSFNPARDTVLVCKKGTKIYMPANALQYEDKSAPKDLVEIVVKECTEITEFIGEKLTTKTHFDLLETGGMLHLSAQDKNKRELFIRDDSKYAIIFPLKSNKRKNGMNLYYGEVDTNGFKTWSVDTTFDDRIMVQRPFIKNPTVDPKYMSYVNGEPVYFKTCELDLKSGENQYSSSDMGDEQNGKKDDIYLMFEEMFAENRKMQKDFCECQLTSELQVTQDPAGNIYGLKFEKKSRPEYDSLIVEFFKSLPKKNATDIMPNAPSTTTKMTISFKDKVEVTQKVYGFNKQFEEFRNKAMEVTDSKELDNYVLIANGMGWINCDRINAFTGERAKVIVKTLVPAMTSVWIILKKMTTLLPGEKDGKDIIFNYMPVNEPIKLVAINYENLQPQIAVVEGTVSGNSFTMNSFKPFTLDELQKELNLSQN